ncbi:MAG: lamin tail domain-containing protein [Myxococcota bacterium]
MLLNLAAMAASPSAPGDLTVTEFMAETGDASGIPNYAGEWFELYNASGQQLDLDGLTIFFDGATSFTVSQTLLVDAGDYVVFGVNDCDESEDVCGINNFNGGVPVDFTYSWTSFKLQEDGGALRLVFGGVEIDAVIWDATWNVQSDQSWQANTNAFDLEWANNLVQNWCVAPSAFGPTALTGTPGAPNVSCVGSGIDDDGDGFTEDGGDCDDADPYVNPDAVDGDEHNEECGAYALGEGCCGQINDDADCDGVRDDGVGDDDDDGYAEIDGDCDDADPSVGPEGVEDGGQPGVDDDCNGCVDDVDDDGDGYSECPAFSPICDDSGPFDCDDSTDTIGPDADEVPYDTVDNDCDGADLCDADFDGFLADPADVCPGERCCDPADFPGLTPGDCKDDDNDVNPAGSEGDPNDGGVADGLDNDCNGVIDDPYQDRDGDGVAGSDGDCLDDPTDPVSVTVFPGATEVCDDGIDNNCDGNIDDDCLNPAREAGLRGGGLCGLGTSGGAALWLLSAMMVFRRRTMRGG